MSKLINRSKKLLVFIPTLNSGGAERVCVNICNYLVNKDSEIEITIACLKAEGELIQKLDSRILLIDIDHPSVYFSIYKIAKCIREIRPTIIISWMGYLNAYLILFKPLFSKQIQWYCRESSLPSELHKYFKNGFFFNFLYKFYNRYKRIICQSEAMAQDLKINFKVLDKKILVINNPFQQILIHDQPLDPNKQIVDSQYKLLYVGRLHHVKRVHLLIEMMRYLDNQYSLTIVGDGPEKSILEALTHQYNLSESIRFIGSVASPGYYYKNCSLLLISSLYEGFPNVVLEALSFGCPVIGYQVGGGADEVLQNYGCLHAKLKSIEEFASVIKNSCENIQWDKDKIVRNITDKYSINKIGKDYYELIFSQ